MGLPNPSREAKFSGANAGREILIFPAQLTTTMIGNLTRLTHSFVICVTIHTYIYFDLEQVLDYVSLGSLLAQELPRLTPVGTIL